jgi:hypothetical protein
MSSILALWLPTLLSAVAVFILSSILHMVLPWHKNDFPAMPNEAAAMDALRPLNIPPGEYMVPRPAGTADMKSPEFAAKVQRGPVFLLNMMPNEMMPMGKALSWWFVYILVVAGIAGHIAHAVIRAPFEPREVFHTVGLSSWMGYSMALWQMSIWYRRPVKTVLKGSVDGLLYALVTGFIFCWLWPK